MGVLQEGRCFSLNFELSHIHLSNILPVTCVQGKGIQGTSNLMLEIQLNNCIARLNLLSHLEDMDKISYIISLSISCVPYYKIVTLICIPAILPHRLLSTIQLL